MNCGALQVVLSSRCAAGSSEQRGSHQVCPAPQHSRVHCSRCSSVHHSTISYFRFPRESNHLIELPGDYSALINQASSFTWVSCLLIAFDLIAKTCQPSSVNQIIYWSWWHLGVLNLEGTSLALQLCVWCAVLCCALRATVVRPNWKERMWAHAPHTLSPVELESASSSGLCMLIKIKMYITGKLCKDKVHFSLGYPFVSGSWCLFCDDEYILSHITRLLCKWINDNWFEFKLFNVEKMLETHA